MDWTTSCVFNEWLIFICAHADLPQGGAQPLTTVHQMSTVTPVCRNPTPHSPMATSAKTALYILRRWTLLLHGLHHHRHHLRLQWLPRVLSPRHLHLSQVYTPETGVRGARQVRSSPTEGSCLMLTCSSETNGWRPVSKFSCDNESIIGSGLSPGVLVSISKTCMHYSQRALAPVVSLVTLLFHNVLWLRSRAKSPPGKGIHQDMFFAFHPVPIILSFSSSVGSSGNFSFQAHLFFQPVQNLQLASHRHSVRVCFCFTCTW